MPLSDFETHLCGVIERRRGELLSDLARHVAIPTGHNFTPGLDEYREMALDRLRALGASVEYIAGDARPDWLTLPGTHADSYAAVPPTALARAWGSPAQRPRILIAGHLDTVHDPHGPFRALSQSPDGKTVVGPGAVDMKGGIVIALAALEALHECGASVCWTFLLNSDEETGSFHSYQAIRDAAREHDIGLALEPAMPDGGLVVQRMGAGQFKVEVFGRAAHVGRDFTKGVSAVTGLGAAIVRLAAMAQPDKGLVVNVGPLQGGSATNIVADYAACWGNVRFRDEAAARALSARLDGLPGAIRGDASLWPGVPVSPTPSGDRLPMVHVHRAFNRPAKPLTPEVQKLASVARAVAEDLGQHLPFGTTGGVCDGNIMQEAGLPTIDTLGVRGGNLHRTDEFVEVASLTERAQLLAVLIFRLSQTTSSLA
jgi:glutamate carboxypeptidase